MLSGLIDYTYISVTQLFYFVLIAYLLNENPLVTVQNKLFLADPPSICSSKEQELSVGWLGIPIQRLTSAVQPLAFAKEMPIMTDIVTGSAGVC